MRVGPESSSQRHQTAAEPRGSGWEEEGVEEEKKNEAYIMTTVVHTVPRYSPGRL